MRVKIKIKCKFKGNNFFFDWRVKLKKITLTKENKIKRLWIKLKKNNTP